jgi:hypothetical protein
MDQVERMSFGTRLRRTWETLTHALEGMDRSPMEDVFSRLERLERCVEAQPGLIALPFTANRGPARRLRCNSGRDHSTCRKKVRSSERIKRSVCANAKFACPS